MLKLITHPNPILEQELKEFDFVNPVIDPHQLEEDMVKLMWENNGIGLAANQVGIDARVFTIMTRNLQGVTEPFAVFNPKIIAVSNEEEQGEEGCLSFPGMWLMVKRPAWIRAEYQDSDGNTHEVKMDGYLSKCFQHEYDHLEGICFVDRVSQMKLQLAMKKINKRK